MQCPRCDNVLTAIDYEGVEIEACSNCGGEWFDGDELGKVVRIREQRFNEDEQRAIAASDPVRGVPVHEVEREVSCPRGDGPLKPLNYGGNTGIIIDRCTTCEGVWLDAEELEKVQMLVEAWKDNLPEDLKKYGPMLREIEREVDARDDVQISSMRRFPGASRFINSVINGILDLRR